MEKFDGNENRQSTGRTELEQLSPVEKLPLLPLYHETQLMFQLTTQRCLEVQSFISCSVTYFVFFSRQLIFSVVGLVLRMSSRCLKLIKHRTSNVSNEAYKWIEHVSDDLR